MDQDISPTPTGLVLSLLKAGWKHQDHLLPLIKSYRHLLSDRLRISMACLVRFEHQGRFILARNRLRQEYMSPYGGVIKFHESAHHILNSMEYQPEDKYSTDKELRRDLRGYIKPKDFGAFMTWFKSRHGREQSETVRRELTEEFVETSVPASISETLINARYSLERVVHEGPHSNNHQGYATFRYLEIYAPEYSTDTERALSELSTYAASGSSGAFLVTREDIMKSRRQDGMAISGSTKYFFSKRWHGQEPTTF